MNLLYEIFGVPFGFLMKWIYNIVNNYGVAIILFTVVTKIILLPVNYKTQKGAARMQMLNPQLAKIRKSFKDNPQKLQEEQMKLYQKEGVNPMGSCLPAFIQIFLLFGVLDVVYRPLSHILSFNKSVITEAQNIASGLLEAAGKSAVSSGDLRRELHILEQFGNSPESFSNLSEDFSSRVGEFANNFQLFGLNLGDTPTWSPEVWNAHSIGLFLIPIFAGISQLIFTAYSQIRQKRKNPDAPTMAGMNIMMYVMPIFSVFFAFNVPAGVGFYWIISSIVSLIITFLLNQYFDKNIDAITAKDKAKAKKYAEVHGEKKTFMQKMMDQQQMVNQANEERKNTVYKENGEKMSRSEINVHNRNLLNEARQRMADKYGDEIDDN